MKKILTCSLKAFIATLLTLLGLFIVIKFGIWFFSLNPVFGIIILFSIIIFIAFFQMFYGNLNCGIFEIYKKYIDGDDDV